MRVNLKQVKHGEDKLKPIHEYGFTESVERALFWDTSESAELDRSKIDSGGITVKSRDGRIAYCTDFRVEPRPQGGFAISCEHPHASDLSDSV